MGAQETSYRISQVKPDSPAANLHIEPMLDFVIHNPTDNLTFEAFIAANENKEMPVILFNIASQESREDKIIPKKWKGEGLLGLTLIKEDYKLAHTKVIRILSILVNSPLHKAGFKPSVDYIISTPKVTFDDVESFNRFIASNNKKEVELIVYNSKEGRSRVVKLVPDSNWGGNGHLGGEIGFGHIHSLPVRKSEEIVKEELSTTMDTLKNSTEDIKESKVKEESLEQDIEDSFKPIEEKKEFIKEEIAIEKPIEQPITTEEIKKEETNAPSNELYEVTNEEVEKAVEVKPQINHESTKQDIQPSIEKEVERAVEVTRSIESPVKAEIPIDTKATYTQFEEDIMI